MSMNYNDPIRPTVSATEDEGLLFAPVPAWERGKKRRGLGMKAAKPVAETRTFDTVDTSPSAATYRDERTAAATAAMAGATTIDSRDAYGRTTTTSTLAAEDAAFAAPIGRTTTVRKTKSGVPGAAVAAGIAALAAIGGAGWYMSQDNDTSVAELTPGMTETSTAALATAPIAPPVVTESRPTQVAAAEPARASAPTTRRVTTARTRTTTAAPSASEQGINASGTATLPAGPQPYSTLPGATPAPSIPVTPPATEAPVTATPPVSAEPVPVNPPASESAPTPTEEPTAPDPT